MAFFQNNINTAIAAHNAQNKILVAFVKGTDDVSGEVERLYNDPDIQEILKDCIGISMNVNSEEGKMFSEMYPVVIVPSSYFISFNGIPIEVIAGTLPKEEFLSKLQQTKKLHLDTLAKNGIVVTAPTAPAVSTASSSIPDTSKVEPKPQASKASTSNDSQQRQAPIETTDSQTEPQNATESTADLDERIRKANELREMNKYMKEQEELQKEKEREKNRIRESKDLLSAQAKRQQNESERLAKEVAKEREEAKLYHQRLKDQIAQDKAERAAIEAQRMAIHSGDAANQKKMREDAAAQAKPPVSGSNTARIQFRLPDGSVVVHQFEASEPLQNLYNYVRHEIQPAFSDFHLAMQYPRQQFSTLDFAKSLKEMCLSPSASILVIPVPTLTSQAVTATSSSLYSMLSFITLPFFQLYDSLKRYFFPSSTPRPSPPPTYTSGSGSYRANQNASAPPPTENSAPNQSNEGTSGARKRKLSPRNVQKKGNVFQLANASDEEDDEDNTWNGNSTQQM